jgi:hypothetical protein
MGCEVSTLLDILNSQQFRTVLLFAVGLDIRQIANLLETSEPVVCSSLSDCFRQVGCQSAEGLAIRLCYEFENGLYDERLEKELECLQDAAKQFLEKEESTSKPSTSTGNRRASTPEWVM